MTKHLKNDDDDSEGEGSILRFNLTLQSCLIVSAGNDVYNPTKYDKKQFTVTLVIRTDFSCGYFYNNGM